MRGEIAKEISKKNILGKPVVFRTHGGRARAIEAGELKIDVAFIAAPACDKWEIWMGQRENQHLELWDIQGGCSICRKRVAITDNLMPFPLKRISIPMTQTDYVVVIESIVIRNR